MKTKAIGFLLLLSTYVCAQAPISLSGGIGLSGGISVSSNNAPAPPPPCKITTAPLPSGTVGIPYTASMTTSNCTAPLTWTLAGGSGPLPNSLSQNGSTGQITGTPTVPGTFTNILLHVVDFNGLSDTQTQSITIAAASGGPPTYNGSFTSITAVVQDVTPTPNMGGTTGTNTCVTMTDFNQRVCRMTDINTAGGAPMQVTISGANGHNMWNTDSTFLIVSKQGGGNFAVLGFDPTTQTAAAAVVPGFTQSGEAVFSRTNPKVLYLVKGASSPVLTKWTFTDNVTAPTSTTVYDFVNQCPGFPNPFVNGAIGMMAIDATDTVISLALATGGQDTGHLIAAYNFSLNKCSVYDTLTGTVFGNWGATGAITDNGLYKVHDSYLGQGAITAIVMAANTCVSGSCSGIAQNTYFWTPGTTTVFHATNGGGHNVPGFVNFVNFYPQYPRLLIHNMLTNVNSSWPGPYPNSCCSQVQEAHLSWNNDNGSDSFCVFETSSTTPNAPAVYTTPFVNEVTAQCADGTFRRFAHTMVTGTSTSFNDADAIGTVDQLGKCFAWTSDWKNSLGGRKSDIFTVCPQ